MTHIADVVLSKISKCFEVLLSIFEFSYVQEIVES